MRYDLYNGGGLESFTGEFVWANTSDTTVQPSITWDYGGGADKNSNMTGINIS